MTTSIEVTLTNGKRVKVADFAEASKVVQSDRLGMGGNEWYGHRPLPGSIFVDGKQVAHVSYNGRVWEGPETFKPGQKEIIIEVVIEVRS